MTLYSFDRQLDEEGEVQPVLEWKTRTITDANGLPKLFYYAELHSITLKKPNSHSSRPLYNSKLCQLEFQLKIKVNFQVLYIFIHRKLSLV